MSFLKCACWNILDMSEEEENTETERAIDEIIEYDPLNVYKKAMKPVETPLDA